MSQNKQEIKVDITQQVDLSNGLFSFQKEDLEKMSNTELLNIFNDKNTDGKTLKIIKKILKHRK